MKKIFITGSEGFIGSHLVEKLSQLNFKVTALVKYNFDNNRGWLNDLDSKLLKNIKIVFGDINDYDLIEKLTKNIDCIVNLAALIGIPYSYKATKSYIDTNIQGTFNILKAAEKNKVKRIIQTSTSEVYGGNYKTKIKENFLVNAQSPYAATKIAADQLCNSFYCSFKTPVIIIRPFNTFGPRQSNRAIIPTIINQLLNSKILKLGNVNTFRDLCFVDDTVQAFIKLIKTKKNVNGQIFNVGTGNNISIKELANELIKISKKKIIFKYDMQRKRPKLSEVNYLLADSSKIKRAINWKPKYNDKKNFKIALKKTFKWFQDNSHKYKNNQEFVE